MTEKAGRSELLDQLKGLGIVLVVIGHFIEPYRERFSIINSIFICIYAFHMPLLCLLSGMVAKFDVRYIYISAVGINESSRVLCVFYRGLSIQRYPIAINKRTKE